MKQSIFTLRKFGYMAYNVYQNDLSNGQKRLYNCIVHQPYINCQKIVL